MGVVSTKSQRHLRTMHRPNGSSGVLTTTVGLSVAVSEKLRGKVCDEAEETSLISRSAVCR